MPPRHPSKAGPEVPARSIDWPTERGVVQPLFVEYRKWLADHQETSAEGLARAAKGLALVDSLIEGLPGAYGPPTGDVLLWRTQGAVAVCGSLRQLEKGLGEIKRIAVAPEFRGVEFGRIFVREMLRRSGELGYERVRVDTLPSMSAAIQFYEEAGFRRIPPYWPHPVAGAIFFEVSVPR